VKTVGRAYFLRLFPVLKNQDRSAAVRMIQSGSASAGSFACALFAKQQIADQNELIGESVSTICESISGN
jgi:hypothetical protein